MEQGSRERRQRAREARERRERAAARRAQRKKVVAVASMLVVVGIGCVAGASWLSHGISTPVNGRLFGIQELAFVEGSQRDGGISPVCGCKEPPVDSWRGVEFTGRRVTLVHRGSPWAQWAVSSAEPKPVSLSGDYHLVRARAYRVRVRGHFDSSSLLAPSPSDRLEVQDVTQFESYGFSMLTGGGLQVSLPGPAPIGAWIPFPGSRVELGTTRSPFPSSRGRPRLVEHYPPRVGFWPDADGDSHPREPQIYPIGDFLGPVVLWTSDPGARVVGTAFRRPAGEGVITAVVVPASIFSVRIGVAGMPGSAVDDFDGVSVSDPNGDGERVIDAAGRAGTVILTVNEPLAPREYRAVRQRIHDDPSTVIRIPPNPARKDGGFLERGFSEEQRYPPLPDHAGFNVFGPLAAIAFDDVYGHLTVSDEHVDLRGSADVVLRDVERLRNDRDQQLISAPLSTAGISADLQFGAQGTVTVNGIEQATAESKYERPLTAFGTVLSLVAGVFTLINGIRALTERRREDDDTARAAQPAGG